MYHVSGRFRLFQKWVEPLVGAVQKKSCESRSKKIVGSPNEKIDSRMIA